MALQHDALLLAGYVMGLEANHPAHINNALDNVLQAGDGAIRKDALAEDDPLPNLSGSASSDTTSPSPSGVPELQPGDLLHTPHGVRVVPGIRATLAKTKPEPKPKKPAGQWKQVKSKNTTTEPRGASEAKIKPGDLSTVMDMMKTMSIKAIGKKYGCTGQTVVNFLARNGVEARKKYLGDSPPVVPSRTLPDPGNMDDDPEPDDIEEEADIDDADSPPGEARPVR